MGEIMQKMVKLENLKKGDKITGYTPNFTATVMAVRLNKNSVSVDYINDNTGNARTLKGDYGDCVFYA